MKSSSIYQNQSSDNNQRAQTPKISARELKRLREKVYFNEFVKPLHERQMYHQNIKMKKFKQQKSHSSVIQARSSYNAMASAQVSQLSVYKNIEESQIMNDELEKKVKSLKISDYFKGKKLQIKSALKKKTEERKREGFMNQIRTLHQSISSDINLSQKNESSIFHTD